MGWDGLWGLGRYCEGSDREEVELGVGFRGY